MESLYIAKENINGTLTLENHLATLQKEHREKQISTLKGCTWTLTLHHLFICQLAILKSSLDKCPNTLLILLYHIQKLTKN